MTTVVPLFKSLAPRRELPINVPQPEPLPTPHQSTPFADVQPRKAVFAAGAGNTGKTTLLRYLTEDALRRHVDLALFSVTGNPTLQAYFPDTHVLTPARLDDAFNWLMKDATANHALFDLGGGDTSLQSLAAKTPGLTDLFIQHDLEPVLLLLLSPREQDLAPLAELTAASFSPRCTALILNMGRADDASQFTPVREHSIYRNALKSGAVEIWMPHHWSQIHLDEYKLRYLPAQEHGALSTMHQKWLQTWLLKMNAAFSPIAHWLP